jgi:hypothetical protein
VYSTITAIDRENNKEQKRWLIYWTVVSVFHITDFFYGKLRGRKEE